VNEQQTVNMGKEAALVLDSPAFSEAMQWMKAETQQEWLKCPIRDKEGQQLILITARIIEKFEASLRGMIESGKYAEHQIEKRDLRTEGVVKRTMGKFL